MLVALLASVATPRPCITGQLVPNKPYDQECEDFCRGRCSFFNETLGERGMPENITVYRLTPTNVTGIRNKDSRRRGARTCDARTARHTLIARLHPSSWQRAR